jgi:hypothetical protein
MAYIKTLQEKAFGMDVDDDIPNDPNPIQETFEQNLLTLKKNLLNLEKTTTTQKQELRLTKKQRPFKRDSDQPQPRVKRQKIR